MATLLGAESWDALARTRYHSVQLLHCKGKNEDITNYFGIPKYALLSVAGCRLLRLAKNHSIVYVPNRRLFRLAENHGIIDIPNHFSAPLYHGISQISQNRQISWQVVSVH